MTEKLSALMDGELDEVETTAAFARLRNSEDYRRHWNEYHLIGDALRGSAGLQTDMTARVLEALISEPVVLAPSLRPQSSASPFSRTLALAASVAGVTLVAALAWSGRPGAVAEVARAPVEAQVPIQLTGADLQAYLVAHQTHAPSAQGAAHYIKTVSIDAGGY